MATADRNTIEATYADWEAAQARVAALDYDALTPTQLRDLMVRRERVTRSQPTTDHRLINQLTAQSTPQELGGSSWAEVLATVLRISKTEARRRICEAEDLGSRTAMTGESLDPILPRTAEALAAGDIGVEHVRVIRTFFAHLPDGVDIETRVKAEETLTNVAPGLKPEELRQLADRLTAWLHPDGDFSDAERARRRYLTIGRQHADGMSPVRGLLDPEGCATMGAVLAKLAAPGMCKPDDERPCVDGEPSDNQSQSDTRTAGQRNHDALKAMGRAILGSGALGQHNGLPTTIIVSTTLKELESGAGQAVTGGGSLLPIPDLIRLASHAHHYLVVYDDHARIPLYLGRTRRLASPGQRIVLYSRDRGCTRPGCTKPGYWCQANHDDGWSAAEGPTDIDKLSLACGPDNRLLEEDGWTTRKRKDGFTEWIPPPGLDTGQARVNFYHHPERYLVSDDGDESDG